MHSLKENTAFTNLPTKITGSVHKEQAVLVSIFHLGCMSVVPIVKIMCACRPNPDYHFHIFPLSGIEQKTEKFDKI